MDRNANSQMQPIRVKPYPIRGFATPKQAIAHAKAHSEMSNARDGAARLEGSVFIDACWTLSDWILRFDCELSLCVSVEETEVCWRIEPSHLVPIGEDFSRVGAPPVVLDWSGTVGLREMDCSSLVAKRRGSRFKNLFVGDPELYIYLHGQSTILELVPVERIADGRGILYASEGD
jgi:hypothetical protein